MSLSTHFSRRRSLLIAGVLVLSGCAVPERHALTDASAFQRVGRFAITSEYFGQAPDAVQGGFVWIQSGRAQQLDLADPLGSTLARVDIQPGSARLVRANGSVELAQDPDALLAKALGSTVPVSGLVYWLKGQVGPVPAQVTERDDQGRPLSFVQDGWRVQLSRYDDQGPMLLRMNRSQANRSISVRLVVDPS